MFGIGSTELIIIILIALVVLGPSKLPQVMRTVGKALGEFKRLSTDVKSTLDAEVRRIEDDERKQTAKKPKKAKKKAAAKPVAEPEARIAPPGPEPEALPVQAESPAVKEPVAKSKPEEVSEPSLQPEPPSPEVEYVEDLDEQPDDVLARAFKKAGREKAGEPDGDGSKGGEGA